MILTGLRLNLKCFLRNVNQIVESGKKIEKPLKIALKSLNITKQSLFFPLFGKKSFLNRTLSLRKSFLNLTTYVARTFLKSGFFFLNRAFLNQELTVVIVLRVKIYINNVKSASFNSTTEVTLSLMQTINNVDTI